MNVVMTGGGRFVEVQGTGEEATFDRAELDGMVAAASRAVGELTGLQAQDPRPRVAPLLRARAFFSPNFAAGGRFGPQKN